MKSATEVQAAPTPLAADAPPRLEVRNLGMRFGGVRVFENVTFGAPAGRITALVGPNGAGKSTLVNLVSGVLRPTEGDILKDGRSLLRVAPPSMVSRGVARTFQDVRVFPTLSVLENVMVALPQQPGDDVWRLFGRAWRSAEARNRRTALELLARVGLESVADRAAEDVPFGSQKLLGVVRAVATGADTLLLDESTTGLEVARIPLATQLFRELRAVGKTILLIEHNMDVVADLADHVVVLHGTVIASGDADHVLRDEVVIREYLGRLYDA